MINLIQITSSKQWMGLQVLGYLVLLSLVLIRCSTGPSSEDTEEEYGFPWGTSTFHDSEPAWSSDGQYIAYRHGVSEDGEPTGIWLLELESNSVRLLTKGRHPSWSPDAKQITFSKDGDIYVFNLKNETIRRLTECGDCYYPSWSPDGTRIAFDAVFRGDSSGLWLANPDGSGKKKVWPNGRYPDWSPDGTLLVINRPWFEGTKRFEEIAIVDTAGSYIQRLTDHNSTRGDKYPVWDPNNKRIVWYSNFKGSDPRSGLWMMKTDGTDQRLVVFGGALPSWSPDGKQIVFVKHFGEVDPGGHVGRVTLWVANADGSNARILLQPEDYHNK